MTRVSLDYQLPIANAILTTENEAQAVARQIDKGRDAVAMQALWDDRGRILPPCGQQTGQAGGVTGPTAA